MASIVSYNDIIELFVDIAKRHYQINTFYLGKDWEPENVMDVQYPLLQVYPEFASMPINNWKQYKTLELTLNCKVMDLTVPGEENEMDVHSDTLRIAQDIVNEINAHPFYSNSNISLIETINFTAFEEHGTDITAGWQFDLKLRILNGNTFCGMPIAELDGVSADGPTSTGTIVNTKYLTCATLEDCPVIQNIEDDLVDLDIRVTALEQGSGGGAYIPLAGTSTNLITGPLEFDQTQVFNILRMTNTISNNTSNVGMDGDSIRMFAGSIMGSNAYFNFGAGFFDMLARDVTGYINLVTDIAGTGKLKLDSDIANFSFDGALDYSSNYNALSFVQKLYVDNAIASIPASTLAQVLSIGNSTGANNIVVDAGQLIISNTSTNSLDLNNGNDSILFSEGTVKLISDNANIELRGDYTDALKTINIRTESARNAELNFITNNGIARGQIYVKDSDQTFNFYTVNSDTIFYNGPGSNQYQTLKMTYDNHVIINDLIGSGTRMVVADLNGQLSTQAIPAAITYSAGTGLQLTGNTFSIGGGPSTSFIKADGSYDATTYITSSALAPYLTTATAASTYQPLDADLTSIATLSGTSGFLKTNGAGTWSVDTSTYAKVIVKDATNGTPLTGTTTNTIIKSVLIPANTFGVNDRIRIITTNDKTGTAGTNTIRYYVNTTLAIGGQTIGVMPGVAATRYLPTERNLIVKSATAKTQVYPSSSSVINDQATATTPVSNLVIDWTVNQYIIVASQNSVVGDTSTITYFEITKF